MGKSERKSRHLQTLTPRKTAILTLLLLLSFQHTANADPCQEIIIKTVKPPPVIKILEEGNYTLLDPKERYELMRDYREAVLKLSNILGQYIQLRRQAEEIGVYLSWQWQRVSAGIEYKKDIWKQQIDLNKQVSELRNIETQLILLGITPTDLDLCYQTRRR